MYTDTPAHPGNYTERHKFATQAVLECDSHVSMIPVEPCLGTNHLRQKLKEIIAKNGMTFWLRKPNGKF